MTAALWPNVVTGLVSAWTTATDWPVYDGKPLTWDSLDRGVAVGVEAALEDGQSGALRQSWRDAGPAPFAAREETGTVTCALWAQDGGQDMAGLRADLWACLDDIIDVAVQITPLGIPALTTVTPLATARPLQRWHPKGMFVAVEFDLAYTGLTY